MIASIVAFVVGVICGAFGCHVADVFKPYHVAPTKREWAPPPPPPQSLTAPICERMNSGLARKRVMLPSGDVYIGDAHLSWFDEGFVRVPTKICNELNDAWAGFEMAESVKGKR